MGDVKKVFKERIKELRNEKGLSQQKIADLLLIPKSSYSSYELGTCYPNTDILLKIADFFNISIDYLFGRTDKKELNK